MSLICSNIDHENPRSVFRYRPISVNSLYEISTSSFYLSKPSDFNDPFDCDFTWEENTIDEKEKHITFCGSDVSEESLKELERAKLNLENDLTKEIDGLGITCFTTDPCNPLMWSHYADGHKGVCIEYKKEDVLEGLEFKKVDYDRDHGLIWSSLELGKDINQLHRFFGDIVYKKLPYWSYEKEWRLMVIRPSERVVHMSTPILSVIFGLKCSLQEINKVLNIIRFHYFSGATKLYVMRRSKEGKLVPVELTLEK